MSSEECREPVLKRVPCSGTFEVLTLREQAALKNLRAIKSRARELKQALSETGDALDDQGRDAIERELYHLKQDWKRWEEERRDAAKERMIMLGHEEA
jgi:hypothetical protein